MIILSSNLEGWLEDMSDDEMQQIGGGLNVSCDAYSLETRNQQVGNLDQDMSAGTYAYAQGFSRNLAQDPTTRRIFY